MADFYPRPLRGGRPLCRGSDIPAAEFLSTPSARRATPISISAACLKDDFYPRPLRGGRPCSSKPALCFFHISIHALCEEGDNRPVSQNPFMLISIHALCEEGDHSKRGKKFFHDYFYPRPLRGGRLPCAPFLVFVCRFLSTPSARRATSCPWRPVHAACCISIHALCEEGDGGADLHRLGIVISIHALCEEGDLPM